VVAKPTIVVWFAPLNRRLVLENQPVPNLCI
jgi:hypothetical protein